MSYKGKYFEMLCEITSQTEKKPIYLLFTLIKLLLTHHSDKITRRQNIKDRELCIIIIQIRIKTTT